VGTVERTLWRLDGGGFRCVVGWRRWAFSCATTILSAYVPGEVGLAARDTYTWAAPWPGALTAVVLIVTALLWAATRFDRAGGLLNHNQIRRNGYHSSGEL
jgi:integral membrane sensor domain MASE1